MQLNCRYIVKRFVALFATILAVGIASTAEADSYPTKPIRMIVPWPAGGIADVRARLIGQRLGSAMGQPVIVENRVGASATIAAQAAARAAPDGYTILNGSFIDQAVVLAIFTDVPYNPERDFIPVAGTARSCLVLIATASQPVNSVADFFALVRSRPGQMNYASSGNGTPQHLVMERLKISAGIDLVHVPYKGGAPALQDVVAGHVPFMFEFAGTAAAYVRNGKVKPLMTGCRKRVDIFPDVPSAAESGYPDVDLASWGGFFVPAGTSMEIVNRLNREINKILTAPEVRSHTAFSGSELIVLSQSDFAEFVKRDRPRWVKLVNQLGLKE
jgi:tripartite-type tricarboxylate transporter receptor subunit TctC